MTATRAETRENDTPKASQEVEAGLEQQDRDDEKDGHGRSTAESAVTAAGHGSQLATGPTVASSTLDLCDGISGSSDADDARDAPDGEVK